jgi:predicted metal-binding protein
MVGLKPLSIETVHCMRVCRSGLTTSLVCCAAIGVAYLYYGIPVHINSLMRMSSLFKGCSDDREKRRVLIFVYYIYNGRYMFVL